MPPWSDRELELLPAVQVILCLGAFAWNAAMRLSAAVALARASDGDGAAGTAMSPAPRMSRVRVRDSVTGLSTWQRDTR